MHKTFYSIPCCKTIEKQFHFSQSKDGGKLSHNRPAGTWRSYNVASTSMQRHDVASTLRQRCINVMCPLGRIWQIVLMQVFNVPLVSITKTCLYNFDPLKPHSYIVKLGFTGVYIIFLISAQNIDCGYLLEPPRWGGSNEYPQSMFWPEIWKISDIFIWKFSVFGGEIFYISE